MSILAMLGFSVMVLVGSSHTYADRETNCLKDGGFEDQTSRTISGPWSTEGSGFKGIDLDMGNASYGKNNAFIRTSAKEWNAITQFCNTTPFVNYGVSADIRTSENMQDGYFGIRDELNRVIQEVKFGPLPKYKSVRFFFKGPPRQTGVRFFVGYWGAGEDSWIQIDNVNIGRAVRID
jgi:hypothetical protein